MQHERRVFVLLGDERVLNRRAQLPERRRTARARSPERCRRGATRAPCDERRRCGPRLRRGRAELFFHACAAPSSGASAATFTTSRSTSGIASKTFSRNRLPGVTSVTFWRARRGRMAQAVLSAGSASARSIEARRRPPSAEVFSKTWTDALARREVQGHDVDRVVVQVELEAERRRLVGRVLDLDQDLVADRVEQAAPGLKPGDPDVARLLADRDQLDVFFAWRARRRRRTRRRRGRRPCASSPSRRAAVAPVRRRPRRGSGRRSA